MAALTTIATAAGLATTAVSAGKSFIQANKQKKLQQKAEQEADKAMMAARKKFDVNYAEGLSLQKEVFERARENMLRSGEQAITAAQESDPRLLASVTGRVQEAQQKGQREIATTQADRLLELQKLTAAGEENRQMRLAGLDLEEAQGAQLAARDAQEAQATALEQGFKSAGSFLKQAGEAAPLFAKTGGARQLARAERIGARRGVSADDIQQALGTGNRTINGVDVSQVGSMNRQEFQDFMGQQDRAFGRQMRQDLGLRSEFNPFNIF